MKTIAQILLLAACATLAQPATAQDSTNAPATNTAVAAEPSPTPATNPPTPPPSATNQALLDTNPPATPATNAAPAETPATTNTTAPAENISAAATNTAPDSATAASTNTPPVDPNIIPLIQFVDVPLTAAIENLARQAGINYILDPKVGFGQGSSDNKNMPQPNISIRWEKLTAEQALNAILNNYDLQLVPDPRSKIMRVTIKDPALPDPLITKVIQLKYASPTTVLASVQGTLTDRRSKVVPDVRTSQLVIVATEKEMNEVNELVAHLDKPTRQVLIEANLLETSRSPNSLRGVDWTATLQAQHVGFGNGVFSGTSVNTSSNSSVFSLPSGLPITIPTQSRNQSANFSTDVGKLGFNYNTLTGLTPGIGFLNADGASAVLSFLNADSDTKIISTPRTITLDNETADLAVTRASPIINVTPGTAQTAGGSSITYTNLGTLLKVTPRISANDFIQLKIIPEVSSVADTVSRTVNGSLFQADEFDVRRIETQVLIPSGNTLVMGGLVTDQTAKGYSKVPVLGDLPFAGLAFRHESKATQQRNLLIFITPTIVQDTDYQPTESHFLKSKLPKNTSTKIRFWDSGKPIDWTKPFHKNSDE